MSIPNLLITKLGRKSCNNIYYTQIRTSFYNKYKHGPSAISNPEPDYWQWVKDFFTGDGWRFVKQEYKRIKKKPFRRIYQRPLRAFETRIFEHFDTEESIAKWKAWCDNDALAGFSHCQLSRSPAGHALFSGYLNPKVPDDGITQMSGFVCLIGPQKPRDRLLQLETFWRWENFNVFEMRVRGDGRKYNLVLNTGTYYNDLKYYDHHGIPFYTRGGPHWQLIRIPFSKFIFAYKGFVQDDQGMLPYANIKFVSITLCDSIEGPFSLEIDYMGLRHEIRPFTEYTAYEHYAFPHIKYRPLSVDCPPPEK